MSSKNLPLSMKDKFGRISEKPTTTPIDWRMVAIYGGITVFGLAVLGYIISNTQEEMQAQWRIVTQDSNQKFICILKDQSIQLTMLQRELLMTKEFYQNQKTITDERQSTEGSKHISESLEV